MDGIGRRHFLLGLAAARAALSAEPFPLPGVHPRVVLTPDLVREIAAKVQGPFADEYRILLDTAKLGPQFMDNQWAIPGAFMEAGLAWLVERELGRDGTEYATPILALWRKPEYQKPGLFRHFGWQGLVFDWVYDAIPPDERQRLGELLGEWVATWWNTAEVNIDRSGWWYNQHWGPEHLDEPNHRVALCSKLFMSLAAAGTAGRFEGAVQTNLESFWTKFREDGLPALDQMGGVWAESNGHGNYGPILVVPQAFEAVASGLGFDPFAATAADGFLREYIKACVYSMLPHNDKLAWIDDCGGGYPKQHARCAPIVARRYRDPVARWLSDTAVSKGWLYNTYLKQNEVWQRVAFMPADLEARNPAQADWPLAHLFRGAGHVYMRGAWNDPDSTWAFFGAGPSYAGHSRDDEGHFLITRSGNLVTRSGGQGDNDNCYYTGGSLVYNIVTIYHPDEKLRRTAYNENDGGLIRYVYTQQFPVERGHIVAYWHDPAVATYAAAGLTEGYWAEKAREVTRQFLYLRGAPECFVIFDRVESTSAEYPKIWFLHLPSEPSVSGSAEVEVPDHVTHYDGATAVWASAPAGDTNLLTRIRSNMVMRTLAPAGARITKRGGEGHDFWGHPYNPKAQYNHVLDRTGAVQDLYRRAPLAPWRLEVEPPERRERDYFLHLLLVTPDAVSDMPAERVEEEGRLGARFAVGDRDVLVLFDTSGPPGGRLTITRAGEVLHDAELEREILAAG